MVLTPPLPRKNDFAELPEGHFDPGSIAESHGASPLAFRISSCYIIVCLLSFLTAYLALNQVEAHQLHALKNSTLFYSSHDHQSSVLAQYAKNRFDIHTLDLSAPNAGATVYRLTGTRTALSPTLLIPQSSGAEIASGPYAVNQALQPIISRVTPIQEGKWALFVMTGLILLAIVFETELGTLVAFLPMIGLVAVSALWGSCLHCNSGGSMLSTFAPLLELVYLGTGMALFTIPMFRRREAYIGFLIISGLIPAVQAYMLVSEPKLCPACLSITFTAAAYFIATLKTLVSSKLPGVAAPVWLRAALVMSLGLLLIRHSLILGGYISSGKPAEQAVSSVIGTLLSKFIPSMPSPQPGKLFLISLEGCHACQAAEQDLPKMDIAWQKAPVCSMLTKSGCFNGKGLHFPTPMLLMCDKSGRIIYQHEGWAVSPQEHAELKAQIQNLQRRYLQKSK